MAACYLLSHVVDFKHRFLMHESIEPHLRYANCNSYCIGGDNVYVGRQAAGLSGFGGLPCADHEERQVSGTWYSLPAQGRCQPDSLWNLGTNCSWHIERTVGTMDTACLYDRNRKLHQKCATAPPWDSVTTELLLAVAPETAGGCSSSIGPRNRMVLRDPH